MLAQDFLLVVPLMDFKNTYIFFDAINFIKDFLSYGNFTYKNDLKWVEKSDIPILGIFVLRQDLNGLYLLLVLNYIVIEIY